MSDLAEVKTLFEEGQKTITALRAKVEDMEKKGDDAVSKDEVKKLEADFAQKFSAQQEAHREALARIDEAETKLNRPGGAGAAKGDPVELKTFTDWMKGKPSEFEQKAAVSNDNPQGGYAVPVSMRDGITARLRRTSPVRSVANAVTISGNRYEMLIERGDSGFEWTGETQAPSETATPTINKIAIDAYELSAKPKASQWMLDDANFDVASWLEGRIVDRFARAEAQAFVAGNGVGKPKGFLTYPTATTADESRANATLQVRGTGSSGAFAGSGAGTDVLIKTVFDLQAAFRPGAVWMMKSTTASVVATLKDGDGNYIFREALSADQLPRIRGYAVAEAEDMPEIGAGSLSVAFGNFVEGYTIVDSAAVFILRDPYSAKPFTEFYIRKRVGGGVSNFDTIKLIQFS